jgi:hypothetical protein
MNSSEALLNGINGPGARNTWVVGEDYTSLDHDIKGLYPTHTYRQIAAELRVPEYLVHRRVRQLIKHGEVHGKMTVRGTCMDCGRPLCFVPKALEKVKRIGTPEQIGLTCNFWVKKKGAGT